jgi:hypothetical protein
VEWIAPPPDSVQQGLHLTLKKTIMEPLLRFLTLVILLFGAVILRIRSP